MPTMKQQDRVGQLVRDVEALAKRLANDLRRQAAHLPKDLQRLVAQLRKQAADAAAQVERYLRMVRRELAIEPQRKPHHRTRAIKRRAAAAR